MCNEYFIIIIDFVYTFIKTIYCDNQFQTLENFCPRTVIYKNEQM